jgi:hypothetical protein
MITPDRDLLLFDAGSLAESDFSPVTVAFKAAEEDCGGSGREGNGVCVRLPFM